MKSGLSKALSVAALSVLVLGGTSYGLMIQDGGFDTTTTIGTGTPAAPSQAWFVQDAARNDFATWAIVDGYAVATPGPVDSWGSADNIQALRQYNVAVDGNTTYTLSFDYQTLGSGFNGDNVGEGTTDPSLSEMQLQVLEFGADGSLLGVIGLGNIGAGAAQWTHASYSFLTGTDVESVGFKFGALFAAGSQDRDSIRLDNVSVPDGGMTVGLLGLGMAGLALLRRKLS